MFPPKKITHRRCVSRAEGIRYISNFPPAAHLAGTTSKPSISTHESIPKTKCKVLPAQNPNEKRDIKKRLIYHLGPDLIEMPSLSKYHLFAISHHARHLPPNPNIGRLSRTSTLPTAFSLTRLQHSSVRSPPCSFLAPSTPSTPSPTTIRGVLFNG